MNWLVPLAHSIADRRHGRNLRIIHLLNALPASERLTCLCADEAVAAEVRAAVPAAEVRCATDVPLPPFSEPRASARAEAESRMTLRRTIARSLTRRVLNYLGVNEPLQSATRNLAEDFDIVLGFDVPSVPGLLAFAEARGVGSRTTVWCDVIDDPRLTRRSLPISERLGMAGLKQAVVIRHLRRHLLPLLDGCSAVSSADAASLAGASGRPVAVVPNGVQVPEVPCAPPRREPMVVFTGAMSFPPNIDAAVWFATRIWPRVRQALQQAGPVRADQARLAIVGSDPVEAVRRLAEIPGVIVTGTVPSVGDWLWRARLAVAPMRTGTGIKNKILEAWAHGCPVVASRKAVAGLEHAANPGLLVADAVNAWIEQVTSLWADPDRADRFGQAARRKVAAELTWAHAGRRLIDQVKTTRTAWSGKLAPPRSESQADPAVTSAFHLNEEVIHAYT